VVEAAEALIPLIGRDARKLICCLAARAPRPAPASSCSSSANPGLGKSRITTKLEERLQAEPHSRLRYVCSLYHQDARYPSVGPTRSCIGANSVIAVTSHWDVDEFKSRAPQELLTGC
jgi:hypothetical protein